jgi:oligopeptide/dipeptide ABC transporter ATP-binding protein
MPETPLLSVQGLTKYFPLHSGAFGAGAQLRAVNNVSFVLQRGRTLALVGESGCGKSTTGRMVLRLVEPSAGEIQLDGIDVLSASGPQLSKLRRRMQIVFQDPMGALNPRLTVGASIVEPLLVHGIPASERDSRLAELLRDVELDQDYALRYPHELSGGQRQRVCIARALALRPELIVADEPLSALDASIQAQILELLLKLQEEHHLSYLFISHDLSVVRFLADEVAVMYFGEIVESGPVEAVFNTPQHPYTRALLAAIPLPIAAASPARALEGILPDASAPPLGCPFASRCCQALPRCSVEAPPMVACGGSRFSRCWLNEVSAEAS